jgi:hypothetical protein
MVLKWIFGLRVKVSDMLPILGKASDQNFHNYTLISNPYKSPLIANYSYTQIPAHYNGGAFI